MTEAEFIAALRALPLHSGARGLVDDAAVIDRAPLVITTDTLVEGVHFLPDDIPADVAWKLLGVNLSDLAAKGATPEGILLNYPLSDHAWDRAFLAALAEALTAFNCPLIGGDTVSLPDGAPRLLTVTALGHADFPRSRTGARPGDGLWVTGYIGDAGAGLALARGVPLVNALPPERRDDLLRAYHRPRPLLGDGRRLSPDVHAMSDVSDGLLIDAARMADASGLAVTVDLSLVPLSPAYLAWGGDPLSAATAGDDYQLLFALPADARPAVEATRVGSFVNGDGLVLTNGGTPVPLPPRLGFEH